MAKKTELEIEQAEQEKQAEINGYQQLLNNSRDLIIAGYEGLLPQAEFDELRENRRKWTKRIEELKGETHDGEQMTTDILTIIENIEVGEYDATAINELAKTTAALAEQVEAATQTAAQALTTVGELEKQIEELEPGGGGSFPESKYTPGEIVGAVEAIIDGIGIAGGA